MDIDSDVRNVGRLQGTNTINVQFEKDIVNINTGDVIAIRTNKKQFNTGSTDTAIQECVTTWSREISVLGISISDNTRMMNAKSYSCIVSGDISVTNYTDLIIQPFSKLVAGPSTKENGKICLYPVNTCLWFSDLICLYLKFKAYEATHHFKELYKYNKESTWWTGLPFYAYRILTAVFGRKVIGNVEAKEIDYDVLCVNLTEDEKWTPYEKRRVYDLCRIDCIALMNTHSFQSKILEQELHVIETLIDADCYVNILNMYVCFLVQNCIFKSITGARPNKQFVLTMG